MRIALRAPALALLAWPVGLAAQASAGDEIFAANLGSHTVARYNAETGAFKGIFTDSTSGLRNATGLAFGPDGHLYVSSSGNHRILRFDGETGKPLGVFVEDSILRRPFSLAFGPDGMLYVSDASARRVIRYDPATGDLLNVVVLLPVSSVPVGISFGEAAIIEMHQRYAGAWVRSFTFVQKTTFADGRVETWHEAAELPGKLRIDIAPLEAGRAMIFRGDSIYVYRNGVRGRGGPLVNPLLLVLYDLHYLPPDTTIARMRRLGFDLRRSHETTWEGRPVVVLGADAGDSTSMQLWVEKERMLPVRLLEPSPNGAVDHRISGYTRVGGGWGERRVETWQGGRRIQLEEYQDYRAGAQHEAGLFDPTPEYRRPAWITRGR